MKTIYKVTKFDLIGRTIITSKIIGNFEEKNIIKKEKNIIKIISNNFDLKPNHLFHYSDIIEGFLINEGDNLPYFCRCNSMHKP
jgi:hypothetical protein